MCSLGVKWEACDEAGIEVTGLKRDEISETTKKKKKVIKFERQNLGLKRRAVNQRNGKKDRVS